MPLPLFQFFCHVFFFLSVALAAAIRRSVSPDGPHCQSGAQNSSAERERGSHRQISEEGGERSHGEMNPSKKSRPVDSWRVWRRKELVSKAIITGAHECAYIGGQYIITYPVILMIYFISPEHFIRLKEAPFRDSGFTDGGRKGSSPPPLLPIFLFFFFLVETNAIGQSCQEGLSAESVSRERDKADERSGRTTPVRRCNREMSIQSVRQFHRVDACRRQKM